MGLPRPRCEEVGRVDVIVFEVTELSECAVVDGKYLESRTGLVYERIACFPWARKKAVGSLGGSREPIRGIDVLGGLEGSAFRAGRTCSDPPSRANPEPDEVASGEDPVRFTYLCARPAAPKHRNDETDRANPRRSRRHVVRRAASARCSRHDRLDSTPCREAVPGSVGHEPARYLRKPLSWCEWGRRNVVAHRRRR